MEKIKLKTGDQVFIKYNPWGNNDRDEATPFLAEVTRVGRKYFYLLIQGNEIPFSLDKLPLPYVAGMGDYSLFKDEAQYLSYKKHRENCDKLSRFFSNGKHRSLSNEHIDKLIEIIGEDNL